MSDQPSKFLGITRTGKTSWQIELYLKFKKVYFGKHSDQILAAKIFDMIQI